MSVMDEELAGAQADLNTFAKALVEGVWDTTALMRSNAEAVAQTAASLPYVEDAD